MMIEEGFDNNEKCPLKKSQKCQLNFNRTKFFTYWDCFIFVCPNGHIKQTHYSYYFHREKFDFCHCEEPLKLIASCVSKPIDQKSKEDGVHTEKT